MSGTLEKLNQLQQDEVQPQFSLDFEKLLIPFILDHPEFAEIEMLKPEYFQYIPAQWVIAHILGYYDEYKVIPTRIGLREILLRALTVDDRHEEVLGLVDAITNPRDAPLIRKRLTNWIRDRAYGQLYSEEAQEAYAAGDYEALEEIVQKAAKITNAGQKEAFGFVCAVDFLKKDLSYEWLIDEVLVANQPFVLGGKKKTLKTGILCDMAVSLATATPFLGHFTVPKPRRVAFFSAESGEHDIQRRIRVILRQKQLGLETSKDLFLSFQRPRLSDKDDLALIKRYTTKNKIDVVIIDPLYLTLLAGPSAHGVSATDLFQMGAIYGGVAEAIQSEGATPIMAHHFKKTVDGGGDLDLDNLAFVGAAEFARQSLLIGRRSKFTNPRNNCLAFRTHGFSRGDQYNVLIDEGTTEEPHWAITLEKGEITGAREKKCKLEQEINELVITLRTLEAESGGKGVSARRIRDTTGWRLERFNKVIISALARDIVKQLPGGRNPLYLLN